MKKTKIKIMCVTVVLIVGILFLLIFIEDTLPQNSAEFNAEYISDDYGQLRIKLNDRVFTQREFRKGWREGSLNGTAFSDSGRIAVFKSGERKNFDTAYFLAENNDARYGIKLEDFKGDISAYLFPEEIYYPDFSTNPPDYVYILTTKDEYDVVYSFSEDYDCVINIVNNIYSDSVADYIPEKIVADKDIKDVSIWLRWEGLPYFFEQELVRFEESFNSPFFRVTVTSLE